MRPHTQEHDRINLGRLVRRLEKSTLEEEWSTATQHDAWLKVQGTLEASAVAFTALRHQQFMRSTESKIREEIAEECGNVRL